jgi:hypothetical protein
MAIPLQMDLIPEQLVAAEWRVEWLVAKRHF